MNKIKEYKVKQDGRVFYPEISIRTLDKGIYIMAHILSYTNRIDMHRMNITTKDINSIDYLKDKIDAFKERSEIMMNRSDEEYFNDVKDSYAKIGGEVIIERLID